MRNVTRKLVESRDFTERIGNWPIYIGDPPESVLARPGGLREEERQRWVRVYVNPRGRKIQARVSPTPGDGASLCYWMPPVRDGIVKGKLRATDSAPELFFTEMMDSGSTWIAGDAAEPTVCLVQRASSEVELGEDLNDMVGRLLKPVDVAIAVKRRYVSVFGIKRTGLWSFYRQEVYEFQRARSIFLESVGGPVAKIFG